MALSTGEQEHVAFAGIIDLDGDGRPDNEEFVRILERNNLMVDAYLDLKTGEIEAGEGSTFRTKFLIIGSDAPLVGNVEGDDRPGEGEGRPADRRPHVPGPDRGQAAEEPGPAGVQHRDTWARTQGRPETRRRRPEGRAEEGRAEEGRAEEGEKKEQ